jgi:CRP-like cAMP-binding protein
MPEAQTVGAVERILFLKKLPLLAGLPAEELSVVAEQTRERFFRKGSVILREGEPVSAVYFVVDGKVHITRRGRLLGHAGPGAGVGGIGILARDQDGIGAVCESDTLALELDVDAALEIFEDHFPILHHILRRMCSELVQMFLRLTPEQLGQLAPAMAPFEQPPHELDLVERILLLRRASPFRRRSITALAELSRGMTEVAFDPGVTLWEVGEPSGSLLLVVSGRAACAARGGALRFPAGPGFPLGAAESLGERPRWYTAVTETRMVALHGHSDGLIDVFEDNFEMAMDYLAEIARRQTDVLESIRGEGPESLERLMGCDEPAQAPSAETPA